MRSWAPSWGSPWNGGGSILRASSGGVLGIRGRASGGRLLGAVLGGNLQGVLGGILGSSGGDLWGPRAVRGGGALGGQPPGLLRPSSQRRSHGPASHGAATLLSAMGRVSSVYTLEVESWALTHVLLWQKAAVVRLQQHSLPVLRPGADPGPETRRRQSGGGWAAGSRSAHPAAGQ